MADTETRDPTKLYLDLEGAIRDVAYMAAISQDKVHDAFGGLRKPSDDEADMALWTVNQVRAMAKKLMADYDAKWEDSKADASA